MERFEALNAELRAYGESMSQRPQIIALTKADTMDEESMGEARAELERVAGCPVFVISSVRGDGLRELVGAAYTLLRQQREERARQEAIDGWDEENP